MSYSFIQGKRGIVFSGTTCAVTFTNPVTAGNSIFVSWDADPITLSVSTIADTVNSYTVGTPTCTIGGNSKLGFGYAFGIASGTPTVTVNYSGTLTLGQVWIEEWSGVATSAAFDGANATATAGSGSSGQTFNAGSITTTVNGDLIWGFGFNDGTQSAGCLVHGSGFATGFDDTANSGYVSEFQTQGAAGAINPSFATGTTGVINLFAVAAAFKPAGGPSTPAKGSATLIMMRKRLVGWRKRRPLKPAWVI
jgi:hypothetical protein